MRRHPISLLLALTPLIAGNLACTKVEPITGTFTDTFERAELGPNYHDTGGSYRIEAGKLRVKGAYNKPLWLKRKLPATRSSSST